MSSLLGMSQSAMFQNRKVKPEANSIVFETHGMEPSIVNAIRRTIITDIPIIGFRGEDKPSMEILKNNGPLHNEILLHRIGLIPIHFREEEVESFEADDYEFEIIVDNTTNAMLNVTTKDIKVIRNGKEMNAKETARLFPPNPVSKQHILITRLRKGESLHAKGKAVMDTARTHAGFSPGFCTAYPMADPVLGAQATNILDKERAYSRDEYGDPTRFEFTIESECGLTPKYLLIKAIEILKSKLNNFMQEMYQDDSEKVVVKEWVSDGGSNGYTFEVKDEDDTLGYLIQSHMHHNYVRMKKLTENGKNITYVGYMCPHPLEAVMHVRVTFAEPAQKHEYIEAVAEQCRRIVADLQAIEADWLRFNNE